MGVIALEHHSALFQMFCGRFDNDNNKYLCSYLRWQHGPSDVRAPFSGLLHNPSFLLFLFVCHVLSLLYENKELNVLINFMLFSSF